MISHPFGNKHLFKCILKIDFTKDKDQTTVVFPDTYQLTPQFEAEMIHITQSIDFQGSKRSDCAPYVSLIDLPSVKSPNHPTKKYFTYILNADFSVLILVSKYFHQKLLLWILGSIPDVFKAFYNITFEIDHSYTIQINPPKELGCPDLCYQDMSQMSELSNLRISFLSNFPPFYMFQLIHYLLHSFKIIVLSSSVKRLTDTVFAINSFFYPLQLNKFLIHTIPLLHRKEKEKIKIDGPCIIGVHTSLIDALDLLSDQKCYIILNADVPYLNVNIPGMKHSVAPPKISSSNSKPNVTSNAQPNIHSCPNNMNRQAIITPDKERQIDSLVRAAHISIINFVKQFQPVFPAFHVQAKLCEFTVGLLKIYFNSKSCSYDDIKSALLNGKGIASNWHFFTETSLCLDFLFQLNYSQSHPEMMKFYFPREVGMPVITVPQLPTDFLAPNSEFSPARRSATVIKK
ncbi:hypothetical protein TRFO_36649 [Tritrichomonas foetus]|uniref:cDENN domain-containing protein n=1 Tax=Tritrichomonas foetus TaxID=1144522 RepID=A0A1J4JFX2_9EUKA|nr:hypothetical protein TRFO_36649 [Tritrichomonas foetus]|eukprot:OHS97191.1 hypothetical protein TRFO_36649 [Tritrichomonas foetus]